jgi:hypothetical protein
MAPRKVVEDEEGTITVTTVTVTITITITTAVIVGATMLNSKILKLPQVPRRFMRFFHQTTTQRRYSSLASIL